MIEFLINVKGNCLRGVALLRLDFNTEDEWRMEAAIPTVKLLLRRADKIVIMSHRGRPIKFDKRFSLKRDAGNLAKLLRRKVIFLSPFSFPRARKEIARAPRGSVLLFENLRFLRGEEKNDPRLARALASLGDFYLNDAFAVCHRADASIDAITRFLPPFAGLELEKEIKFLSKILTKPRKPLIIILGGSKAHDKLGVLRYFRNIAGKFLMGGAAANTLLALRGVDVGKSPVDRDPTDLKRLKSIVRLPNIIFPLDWRGNHGRILDIGPKTARHFAEEIKRA